MSYTPPPTPEVFDGTAWVPLPDGQAAYERGVAEGRRQATEGHPDSYAIGVDRGFAIAIETLRDDARYDGWWSALPQDHPDYGYWSQQPRRQFADYLTTVGPWEPAEQATPSCTCPMLDVTNIRETGEGIRTFMQGLDPACPVCVRANAEQVTVRLDNRDATYVPADPPVPFFEGDEALPHEPAERADPHQADSSRDRYMMATTAHHKLGDMSRDEPDLAIIYGAGETETDYVGQWVTGFGLINMRFPKATTRPLTADERERYRGKLIDEAGAVRPIVIDEPAEQDGDGR